MTETSTTKTVLSDLERGWQTDLVVFIGCAALILLSSLLSINASGAVSVTGREGASLPGVCMGKRLTGVDCPGCGLTRSFVAMGNGQFAQAFQVHRIGVIIYLLVLLQVPLRAYAVVRGVPCLWRVESWHKGILIWIVFAALWVNWFYALYTHEAW